ncbi:MAG: TIGR02646 family protein [Methyloprofundus sp.]|nr:TIGR02646 family protein [Methyloprofundus sp.]
MKKINKSLPPNDLTVFSNAQPQATWQDFRDLNQSADYKQLRAKMLVDQGGLCAYCEKKIDSLSENLQRVEHFHPKSDTSNPAINWALDWQNVFAVCTGGSQKDEMDSQSYQRPDNLSCDAYKDHLISANKLPETCEAHLLNPLLLSPHCLFDLDKRTGRLKANSNACRALNYQGQNQFALIEDLVENTIKVLNLNCQRLCDDRLEVLKQYNQEIARAIKQNNSDIFKQLPQRWFSKKWPSFFTTRRILLGKHAEDYLQTIAYNG